MDKKKKFRPQKQPERSYKRFVTSSLYSGNIINELNLLDGFGIYVYPNNWAQYRGFFKRGKFHGYGCFKILKPQAMEIKGHFHEGVLETIYDLMFGDGLCLRGDRTVLSLLESDHVFADWVYCSCLFDRRYSTELKRGLEAVGPNTSITKDQPARTLKQGHYDTEEGIFYSATGFVSLSHNPWATLNGKNLKYFEKFVLSKAKCEWIKKHCRTYHPHGPVEPNIKLCKKIIENNTESVSELAQCRCLVEHGFDVEKEFKDKMAESERFSCVSLQNSSETTDSFSDRTIAENINFWNNVFNIRQMQDTKQDSYMLLARNMSLLSTKRFSMVAPEDPRVTMFDVKRSSSLSSV